MVDQRVVDDWLEAKKVIRQFIRDIAPDDLRSLLQEDMLAEALIARLANAHLIICHANMAKEK